MYAGPERRIHRVYVTRNTEYHFRRNMCVAVRDRETKRWLAEHPALGRLMAGGIALNDEGHVEMFPFADVGHSLCFRGSFLKTGRVAVIERSDRAELPYYLVA